MSSPYNNQELREKVAEIVELIRRGMQYEDGKCNPALESRYSRKEAEEALLQLLLEDKTRAVTLARIDELNNLPLDGLIDQCFIAFAKRRKKRVEELETSLKDKTE